MQVVLGVALIVLALLTIGEGILYQSRISNQAAHDRSVSACQERYNKSIAENITQRSSLTTEDRAATSMLIKSIFTEDPSKPQEEQVSDIEHDYAVYKKKEAAIDAGLKAHPYPPLSASNCGSVR